MVELEGLDAVGEVGAGGVEGGGAGGEFGLGGGDGVFGVIEVVDESFAGGFVGVFEGGDVGALALFVGAEGFEAGLGLVDGGLGVGEAAAGVKDGLEGGDERGVMVGVGEDDVELVLVGSGEVVGGVGGMAGSDVEADGVAGGDLGAEAVDGRGGLDGFGVGAGGVLETVELPVADDGKFGDDGAAGGGGVVEDERELVLLGALDAEDAAGATDEGDVAGGEIAFGGGVDGLVGGVGEQALFVGVDGIEEAFAAEGPVFDDGEGAAV